MRRIQEINDTKIQYISVIDKIYQVKNIDFSNLTIEAIQTDLSIVDVQESEVFPVEELGEFRVRLVNGWLNKNSDFDCVVAKGTEDD